MKLRKRIIVMVTAFCLVFAFMPAVSGSVAFAEATPQKLKDMNFTGGEQYWLLGYQWDANDYAVFSDTPVSWGSTDEKVAFVNSEYVTMYEASIIPCGVGDCTVWFCNAESRDQAYIIAEAKVHVNKAGLQKFLKEYHFFGENTGVYGAKTLQLEGPPKASYKLRIGNDTYTGTFPETGINTITLKSIYKLNTKITCDVTSGGVTGTWEEKIVNATDIAVIKTLKGKKKVKVTLENPHKGDVVKVKYAGKTYKKKIKKDYDGKTSSVTIKLKKKLKKNKKVAVTVNNKYNQKLDKITRKYKGYTYLFDKYEEDE